MGDDKRREAGGRGPGTPTAPLIRSSATVSLAHQIPTNNSSGSSSTTYSLAQLAGDLPEGAALLSVAQP